MKPKDKKYWQSLENFKEPDAPKVNPHDEFPSFDEYFPSSRRNFLKAMGFGFVGSLVSCSRMPVEKTIPYLIQPDDIVPGKAYWYASTCQACPSACSILVKNREGRPIKIEGNDLSPLNKGGLCSVGQADLLELYDSSRQQHAMKGSEKISWQQLDLEITQKLNALKKSKGKVRVLSETISSPSLNAAIKNFVSTFSDGQHVVYDAISYSALIQAQAECFGIKALPSYRFDQAKVLVSFGADFLGTWLSPVEFSKQYSQRRKVEVVKDKMLRHVQFESRLSLSGANADERHALKPSEMGIAVASLYQELSGAKANPSVHAQAIKSLAKQLRSFKGESLVVSSSNDLHVQNIIAKINHLLGNYEKTIVLSTPSYQRQGDDQEFENFVQDVKAKKVDAVILVGTNPIYERMGDQDFVKAFENVPLMVSLNAKKDESAQFAHYFAPAHHGLESWGDAQPVKGTYHLSQPVLQPVFNTRHAGDSFLRWQGSAQSYQAFLQSQWKANVFPKNKSSFAYQWKGALKDGVYQKSSEKPFAKLAFKKNIQNDLGKFKTSPSAQKGFELEVYESHTLRAGKQANNPWLQELPDPISKVTWDNYASVSVQDAQKLGLKNGRVLSISANGTSLKLPALVQAGQAKGCVSVALGYGRTRVGKAGNGVGVNAFAWLKASKTFQSYHLGNAELKKTARNTFLSHHTNTCLA